MEINCSKCNNLIILFLHSFQNEPFKRFFRRSAMTYASLHSSSSHFFFRISKLCKFSFRFCVHILFVFFLVENGNSVQIRKNAVILCQAELTLPHETRLHVGMFVLSIQHTCTRSLPLFWFDEKYEKNEFRMESTVLSKICYRKKECGSFDSVLKTSFHTIGQFMEFAISYFDVFCCLLSKRHIFIVFLLSFSFDWFSVHVVKM